MPKLNKAITFKEFIASNTKEDIKLIAHCEETKKVSIKNAFTKNKSVQILIGPEGDFSKEEISLAINSGFSAISLGNSRLRTETAAILACHSVHFIADL